MKTIKEKDNSLTFPILSRKMCVVFVWITVLYSSIIQFKYPVSNGMLFLGLLVLGFFILAQTGRKLELRSLVTKESIWMIVFMLYMLPVGLVVAPVTSRHLTQWVTCLEYMFLMIVVSSLLMDSGMESFYLLLLVTGVILAILLIQSPVEYKGTGRFSISGEVNPNGLGMSFAAGIWAILYFQQKKKVSIIISLGIVAFFCYGIIQTGSRKALIATAIITVIWYFYCFIPKVRKGNSRWKSLILIGSIIIIAILGIVFFRMYAGSEMASRIEDLDYEATSSSRSEMYTFGWNLLRQSPLFGLGFQGFKHYYGYYSHATFVEVPVSGGILGCILYFSIYFLSIKKILFLFRLCRTNNNLSNEYGEIVMLMGMWAAMLFYCTCIIHPYQFDSYFVFGIIFGQSAYIEKKIQIQQAEHSLSQGNKCKWIKYS